MAALRYLLYFLLPITMILAHTHCSTQTRTLENLLSEGHIYPPDHQDITHNIVLLEFESIPSANNYEINIMPADCINFEACNTHTLKTQSLAVTVEKGLTFGQSYKWRVQAFQQNKLLHTSPTYQFNILYNQKIDSTLFRHRVIQNQITKLPKGYICVDDIGVIIDYSGQPVYCMPSLGGRHGFECMRMLDNGNIAFLTGNLLEMNLNNDTIFHQKGGFAYGSDSSICTAFHHSFTTTSTGNYLCLGSKSIKKSYQKGTPILELDTTYADTRTLSSSYSMILEIDKKTGKVLWNFDWADYIETLDEQYEGDFMTNGHANAVYYQEAEDFVLVSLRDLHRVIKIDRKTKKVVDSYGFGGEVGGVHQNTTAFKRQHSAELDQQGNLMLYNNDTGQGKDTISSIVRIQIPSSDTFMPKKYWEFKCNFGDKSQSWSKAKGDVDQIDEQHFLVSMGTIPRTFIVNENKEVLWEVIHETFKPNIYNKVNNRTENLAKVSKNNTWKPFVCNYSASFTPTLFPNYFTGQIVAKGKQIFLKINNEGGLDNPISWQLFHNDQPLKAASGQQIIPAHQHTLQAIDWQGAGTYKLLLTSDFDKSNSKTYLFKNNLTSKD